MRPGLPPTRFFDHTFRNPLDRATLNAVEAGVQRLVGPGFRLPPLFRALTLTHDGRHAIPEHWTAQVAGVQGHFARFPESARHGRALELIGTFRFALGCLFEPDHDLVDERLDAVAAVAEALNGVLFTPSALRDPWGRILLGAEGTDAEARCPPGS